MTDHDVVIAGGGPTGLMLGAELQLAGVDVLVLERKEHPELESSRAGGLRSRTLEVLDQRGVADRFVEAGTIMQSQTFAKVPLDISDFPTRFNHGLALWQRDFERILAGWVLDELKVPIERGREVTGFTQDEDGVDVHLSGGTTRRAGYLVGCDGGRSLVRKAAGIGFPGLDPTTSWLIAEADLRAEPPVGLRPEGGGIGPVDFAAGGNPYRIVLVEREVHQDGEPSLEDLKKGLQNAYGTDFGIATPTWLSRFTDATRQAASYREGRVLLAGDAAHVHAPMGGQGLNTGVQDAVNLGWKLAQVVTGTTPESLLDTYQAERHPVGERVLRHTMTEVALSTPGERHDALRETVGDLMRTDDGRRLMGAKLTGLDLHYDLGDGHPLLGRRMPDLDLTTDDGQTRVYELLHDARPLLLNLGRKRQGRSGSVKQVNAEHEDDLELPVIGTVEQPEAILVRPDGHVAWTGALGDETGAVKTWFGER